MGGCGLCFRKIQHDIDYWLILLLCVFISVGFPGKCVETKTKIVEAMPNLPRKDNVNKFRSDDWAYKFTACILYLHNSYTFCVVFYKKNIYANAL